MRRLTDTEILKITAEFLGQIAQDLEAYENKSSLASIRSEDTWGRLHRRAHNCVTAMETHYDTATAGEIATAFAQLGVAVADAYRLTPEFYPLFNWLYERIEVATMEEEAR